MRAITWEGPKHVKVSTVPDPKILNSNDAILKVSSTAICGSDLHLFNGFMPTMEHGDILGHEFMGEVVETGPSVKNLKVGDRVVVPFPIACGKCWSCEHDMWSLCENSNPNALMQEKLLGHHGCGVFGYSHLLGGYAGGQAEYVRVPFADVGPLEVPDGLTDEQALFLTDIFPTGYMGAEMCDIAPGDTITIRSGQCHVHRYMKPLLQHIVNGDIDPSFVITHQMKLDDGPVGYDIFNAKEDDCLKVVLKA